MSKFEEEINIIFENSSAMGLEEIILEELRKKGERKGKKEEKLQVVYHSWKEGLSAELTAKIISLPLERVQELFAGYEAKVQKGQRS